MEIGYFLSSEEHTPQSLVDQAVAVEEAGFSSVFISDHFHPWIDRQGNSPFVWSVIGAIAARTKLSVTTGVTCPTVRIHPAIIAQASATSQLLCEGRFRLGVGTGENLNEHIVGDRWPPLDVRWEMLEEAIDVIRGLWEGSLYSHHGRHYTVENARLYSMPDHPPPILISGFGPRSVRRASKIGDGFVTTKPSEELASIYREENGRGPVVGACKVCWSEDEKTAVRTAYELWPTEALNGELSQELPMPLHFEEASSVVTEEMVAEVIPCGPDPDRYVAMVKRYVSANFDEVFVNQIGRDTRGFLEFFNREVRPRL
jgi:G6PDH family F420-dependent oxidoreductase